MVLSVMLPLGTSAAADACPGQDVAAWQTVVAFNSMTDGQPGTPHVPQLSILASHDFDEDKFQGQVSFSGVIATSGFWCQAQFEIAAPTLNVGNGVIEFEKSATLSWQQRWRIDDAKGPTFSTVLAVQQPFDEPGEKTDVTLTGILANSTRWGAVFVNFVAETSGGVGADNVSFGGVVGIKRIIRDDFAVFADVVIQEEDAYAIELSFQRDFKNGVSVGPGISFAHAGAGSDGLEPSIGLNFFKVFGT